MEEEEDDDDDEVWASNGYLSTALLHWLPGTYDILEAQCSLLVLSYYKAELQRVQTPTTITSCGKMIAVR